MKRNGATAAVRVVARGAAQRHAVLRDAGRCCAQRCAAICGAVRGDARRYASLHAAAHAAVRTHSVIGRRFVPKQGAIGSFACSLAQEEIGCAALTRENACLKRTAKSLCQNNGLLGRRFGTTRKPRPLARYSSLSSLCFSASTRSISSWRECTSSFAYTLRVCVRTVFFDTCKRSAVAGTS